MIEIKISGLREVVDALEGAEGELPALMEDIAAAIDSMVEMRIASGKASPEGAAWAPWAPSYIGSGRPGSGLLVRHGDLLGSIEHEVGGLTATIRATDSKAGWHQHGTPKMPARPFMGISTAEEDEIVRMVEDHIVQVLGGM